MKRNSRTYKTNHPLRALQLRIVVILALSLPVFIPIVQAQQLPSLTQYMFHQMSYNPAYAGHGGGICINGLIREQWIGFKDNDGNKIAPETIFLTVDAPIKFLHGAIGGSIMSDRIGYFQNIGVKVGYAFRTDLGPGEFSAGIQLNLMNDQMDFAKFQDHIIQAGDPVFEGRYEKQSDLTFDADLGVYYEVPGKYYIGLSAAQVFQSKAKNNYLQQRRTYFLTGGYNFVIPNHPIWELKPSALLLYDGGAFSFNIATLLSYKKKFYGGLEYRFQDAIAVLVGANIKSFRVGISYDVSTSALGRYNSGSLEVSLGYCFKIKVDKFRKRYKNTRFL